MVTAIALIAVFFLILGLVFRTFKPVDVLSGISAENVTDRDGLGSWVGNALMAFALLYGLIAFGLHRLAIDTSGASTVTTILIALYLLGQGLVVVYIMGTGKFTKTAAIDPHQPIETEDP